MDFEQTELFSSLELPTISGAPKVSIVIPCYNAGLFLLEAVKSSVGQSYRDFEIVVVNDGSDDPLTLQLLACLSNCGIKVIHSENMGVAAARNLGVRAAAGQFILPLDADDQLSDNFLELTVSVLESEPDVGVVFGQVLLFGEISGAWQQSDFTVKRLLLENMIVVSALYRRDDFMKIGGYRLNMVYGWEDWDFWLSMLELGRSFIKVPQAFFHYRIKSSSRDADMKSVHKVLMFARLIWNHKMLYTRNWLIFLRFIPRIFSDNSQKKIKQ
jgi:glycosyltransferase involved in cell wall biosynthesis